MPLKTKRWCDPKDPDDGYRLLICRYRPRALPKKKETWNNWLSALGPSKELHADFYGKHGPPISFEEYVRRYLEEMQAQTELIDGLAELMLEDKTVTLLCSTACTDESHCHRTLLRGLVEQRMREMAGPKAAEVV